MTEQMPAAWYPDPFGRHQLRYWDGRQWTQHVASNGQQTIEAPVEVPPPPPVGPVHHCGPQIEPRDPPPVRKWRFGPKSRTSESPGSLSPAIPGQWKWAAGFAVVALSLVAVLLILPNLRHVNWRDAVEHVHDRVKVCGPVAATVPDPKGTFLNIGSDYPDPDRFVIVAWGQSLDISAGTEVCVVGEVVLHEGVPQIQIRSMDHLEIDGEQDAEPCEHWADVPIPGTDLTEEVCVDPGGDENSE